MKPPSAGCSPPYLTKQQVADDAQVSLDTVERWIRAKRLRVFRPSKRMVRITQGDWQDFLKRNLR